MAQTGYTPISIYYSATTTNVPTAGNLVAGELAINTADGKLFYKDSAGVVQTIASKAGNAGTFGALSATSITDSGLTSGRVTYATTSGLLTDSANMTFSGTALTLANDASISGLTVGKGAGSNTANSTALGLTALGANTTGYQNDAIGGKALFSNTTGIGNTAVGFASLYTNTTGGNNAGFGNSALYANSTGSNNTAVGQLALQANTTASNNTAVGYQAGYLITGASNTAIGYSAGNTLTTGTNCTLIGYNTQVSAVGNTYELVIGATSGITGKGSSTGYIYPQGGGVYQGNNSATWSITSDKRLKKNIVDNTIGLDKITQIQVRNFEYRTANEVTDLPSQNAIEITGVQLGAIAQELKEILPECVKTESTGVMSVDTTNLTWYLINAVKELNAKVIALENK